MNEQHLTESELEAVNGGLGNLAILGDAGLVLDTSLNNVGNVNVAVGVDASTTIGGSFNTSSTAALLKSHGYPL